MTTDATASRRAASSPRPLSLLAAILSIAVVMLEIIHSGPGSRTTAVLLFASWTPGAVMLSWFDPPRSDLRVGVPSISLSLMVFVLASGLSVAVGLFPQRWGLLAVAAVCLAAILFREMVSSRTPGPSR